MFYGEGDFKNRNTIGHAERLQNIPGTKNFLQKLPLEYKQNLVAVLLEEMEMTKNYYINIFNNE